MPIAIRIHETGGPDVLRQETVQLGLPGPGEISIRHTAIGLNFIDTYHRGGLYKVLLPSGLGTEAAGIVTAIGPGVMGLSIGDRVAYGTGPLGAYAEERLLPADKAVHLPAEIDDRTAAAIMLKGMTAQYLLRQTFRVEPGQFVLFHAAAGGVGQIACQWAKHLGATVIGTVGSPEKVAPAYRNGCDHVIDYTREDFAARVRDITRGQGVPVVYDGVGRSTFAASLDCLAPRGMMVTFGNASGAVPPVDVLQLSAKGSLFLTRPKLGDYIATADAMHRCAEDLFAVVRSGAVRIAIDHCYPLTEAARAHADLEARRTTGPSLFIP
jgi:NADPH2:quinone reductase